MFKNRKGSALALTLIIFAVLMILGTSILRFMVNENKMSLHHQGKTHAYYIARAGAVTVEAAIMDIYNKDDNKDEVDFFNSLVVDTDKNLDAIMVQDKEAKVSLNLASIPGDANNFLLNIKSQSTIDNATQIVEKVLNIPRPINKKKIKVDSPIVYVDAINEKIEKINELKKNAGQEEIAKKATGTYELYEFNPENFPEEKKGTLPVSGPLSGDYYVETLDGAKLKDRVINGKVNIYVKDKYVLDTAGDVKINSGGKAENLNIYVYSGGVNLKGANGKKVSITSNLLVKSGEVNMLFHKLECIGNIVLGNGVDMNINVEDNGGNEHVNIIGLIYGPTSEINIGDDSKGALSVTGGIVGKTVNYKYRVNNLSSLELKVINKEGIDNPLELEENVITSIEKGHFK